MKLLTELVARIHARVGHRSQSENTFLFLLPVVGALVGLITVGTAHLITSMQAVFWGQGGNLMDAASATPWSQHLIAPLVGGLIVGLIGLIFHVQTRGGGISTIIQGLALRGGLVSMRDTVPRASAAMVTIAAGGSLGREGAMALLASALGSNLGRRLKLDARHLRLLVCAAAAAALAAVYNAPIGGALFAVEVLMGNFALEVLGPVVVVSVISTVVYRSCEGNLPRFEVPHYAMVSGWELILYLILGVLAGLVSILFVRALFGTQDLFEKIPIPSWLKPIIGLTAVGALGIVWPHIYGNGFEPVNLTLREQLPLQLLLILLPMKILASSLSFGSGGAGGLFTPSLMVGALLGGVFGYGVNYLFPTITAEHGAYALVGMGGLLAGTIHAPLTAIMMIFEQTNSYQIILPLMFVCIISHATVRFLKGRSMDEESFRRRGIVLPRGPEGSVMQSLRVADVMHSEVQAVNATDPFSIIVDRFLREPHNNLYVTDQQGKFLGAIRLHSLKEMLAEGDSLKAVIALDLLDDTFTSVTPEMKLADCMEMFWKHNLERLPVVNDTTTRRLMGWISKRDLFGIYSQEILQKRQLLGHFVVTEGDEKRDMFVELPEGFELRAIPMPAATAGRTLMDLALRSSYGVHVIAIRRRDATTGRDRVVMPDVKQPLQADDRLIVIGPFEGIAAFIAALATDFPDAAT